MPGEILGVAAHGRHAGRTTTRTERNQPVNNDDNPASGTGSTPGSSNAPLVATEGRSGISKGARPLLDPGSAGGSLLLVAKQRRVEPSVGLRLAFPVTGGGSGRTRQQVDLQPVAGPITTVDLRAMLDDADAASARGLEPGLVLGCGILEWQPDGQSVQTPVTLIPITLDEAGTIVVTGPAVRNIALDQTLEDLELPRPAALIPTRWPSPSPSISWRYERNRLMVFVADHLGLHAETLAIDTEPLPTDESAPTNLQPTSAPTLVDADLDQRTAIAAAREATGLIVRGAAGSGRTHTAAAIAADRVHYGETILIASDRLDSLLRIERKLAEVGLADLLIPLHRLTEDELSGAPEVEPSPHDEDEVTLETELATTAKRLQATIEATDEVREPGCTLIEAIGEVATTPDEAAPAATGVDRRLRKKDIDEVASAVRTLMTNTSGSPGQDGAWYGAVGQQALGSTSDAMLALLGGAKEALERLERSAAAESERIGVPWDEQPADASRLARLSFLLNEQLPCRPEWLTAPSLKPLHDAVAELELTSAAYEDSVEHARQAAGESWKDIDPTVYDAVVEARSGEGGWTEPEDATVADLRRVSEFLRSNRKDFADLERHGTSLITRLGMGHLPVTVDRLPDLVELGELAHANVRPESSWFMAESAESLEASIGQLRLMVNETRIAAKRVEQIFSPKVLDLDLRELRDQLHEQGMLRRLTTAQRTNRNALVEATLEGRVDDSVTRALPDAIAWQDAHRRLQQAERSQPELAGSVHYRGLATDFAQFDEALAVHRRIRTLAGGDIRPSDLVAIFSQSSVPDPALIDASARVRTLLDTWVVEARRAVGPDVVNTLVVSSTGSWCDETIALMNASADAAEGIDGPDAKIRPALRRLEAVHSVHRTWDGIQASDHNTSRLLGGDIPRSEQARTNLRASLEWAGSLRTIVDRPIELDEAHRYLALEPTETTLADDVVEWDRHAAWISRWFRIEDRARVDEALNGSYKTVRAFLEKLRVERPKLSVILDRERALKVTERFGLDSLATWATARDLSAADASAAARRQLLRAWIDVVMQREHAQLFGSDSESVENIVQRYRRQHDNLRRHRRERAREVAVDRRDLINPDVKMSGAIALLGRAAGLLADGLRPDVIVLDLAYPADPEIIHTLLRAGQRRRVLLTGQSELSFPGAVELTLGTDHRSMHPALGAGPEGADRVYPSADVAARPVRVVSLGRKAVAQRIADEVATLLRADIDPTDLLIVVPDEKAKSETREALRNHVSGWSLGTIAELSGDDGAHVLAWLPGIDGAEELDISLACASHSAVLFIEETNTTLLDAARERATFGTRYSDEPVEELADPLVTLLRDRLVGKGLTVRYPPAGVSSIDLMIDRGTAKRPIAVQLDTTANGDLDLRHRHDAVRMAERGWRHEMVSTARLWQDTDLELDRLLDAIATNDISPRRVDESVTSGVPAPGLAVPAAHGKRTGATIALPVPPPPPPPPPPADTPEPAGVPLSPVPLWARMYRPADITVPRQPLEILGDDPRAEIEETILDIVEIEEPVHLARVIRRTAISRGQSPADALTARVVQGVLRDLVDDGVEVDDDGFVVFLDIDPEHPSASVEPRVPSDDPETQRPVAEVPTAELSSALLHVLSDASTDRRTLVGQIAELYRWDATSADLASTIDDLLDLRIRDGRLREDDDRMVHLVGDGVATPAASAAPAEASHFGA